MSYPEGVAAAGEVVRVAERWRDAYGRSRKEMIEADAALRAAIDAYRLTGRRRQPVVAKEAGD